MEKNKNKETKISAPLEFYYFIKVMKECSDENHILREPDINDFIKSFVKKDLGIEIESLDRRRIYKYAELMESIKYDISLYKENRQGFFLRTRKLNDKSRELKYRGLEKEELNIVIESITGNRFINQLQTDCLQKRLMQMGTIYSNETSRHKLYIQNKSRVSRICKEDIYSKIDLITEAIRNNKKIKYRSYRYDSTKTLVCESENEKKEVNPIGAVLQNDRYYLIFAVIKDDGCQLRCKRLDRIKNISISINDRDNLDRYNSYQKTLEKCKDHSSGELDLALYVKKHFKMYSGDNYDKVVLRADDYVVGYIIEELEADYEGLKITSIENEVGNKETDKRDSKRIYEIEFEAAITEGLVKWLLALDSQVKVVEPKELKDMMISKIQRLMDVYSINESK